MIRSGPEVRFWRVAVGQRVGFPGISRPPIPKNFLTSFFSYLRASSPPLLLLHALNLELDAASQPRGNGTPEGGNLGIHFLGSFCRCVFRASGLQGKMTQTSRITGMISGRRWVCLFRKRFRSVRIFSCITPQSPRSSAVEDSSVFIIT
jgi:hypothetical protein